MTKHYVEIKPPEDQIMTGEDWRKMREAILEANKKKEKNPTMWLSEKAVSN